MDQKTIAINMMVTGPFPAQMAAAGASVQTFGAQSSAGMAKAQTSMQKFGKVAIKVGTFALLGVAAGLALSAKAAIDFESSFAGIRKTVDTSEAGFRMLAKGIRQMATEIPIGVNELNRIGELGGQLGVDPANLLGFTETIAKIGVTTTLSTDEAAMGFARIDNIMQMGGKSYDRMGASIVDLGNNFAATEDEILTFALRVAPVGATVGLATDEVLGIATAFTSVGIPAERGGTAIQKSLIKMAEAAKNGGAELDIFAETAGMTGEAFADLFESDPAEAFTLFVEGLARVNEEGGNVFQVLDDVELGNERVRASLLAAANAGDVLRTSLELGATAWGDNTALTEEAQKRFDTTASAMVILKNKIQDMAISIGNELLPRINDFLDGGVVIADFFANLEGGMQSAILMVPIFLAAIAAAAAHPAIAAIIAAAAAINQVGVAANMAAAGTATMEGAARGLNKELDVMTTQQYLLDQGMEPGRMSDELEKAGLTMEQFTAAIQGTDDEWNSFYQDFMGKQPVINFTGLKFWEDTPSAMLQRTRKAWVDAGESVRAALSESIGMVSEEEQRLWDRFASHDYSRLGVPGATIEAPPLSVPGSLANLIEEGYMGDIDTMFEDYTNVFAESFDETDQRIRDQIDLWYEFGDAMDVNLRDLIPNLARQIKATAGFESKIEELNLSGNVEEFIRKSFGDDFTKMEGFLAYFEEFPHEARMFILETEALMGPDGPLMDAIFGAFTADLPSLEFAAGAELLSAMSGIVDEIMTDTEGKYNPGEVWLGVIEAALIRGGPELAPKLIDTLETIFGEGGIPGIDLTIEDIMELARQLKLLPEVTELQVKVTYFDEGFDDQGWDIPGVPAPGWTDPLGDKRKASGGPVSSNELYWVGERGPELFVPFVNGTIIPNNKVGSMSGAQNNISLQFHVDSASTIPDIQTALVVSGVADLVDLRKAGL